MILGGEMRGRVGEGRGGVVKLSFDFLKTWRSRAPSYG